MLVYGALPGSMEETYSEQVARKMSSAWIAGCGRRYTPNRRCGARRMGRRRPGGRGARQDRAALPPPLESSLVGGASSQNKDKSIFRYCLELRSLRISDSGFRSISKEQYGNYNCPYFFVNFNFSTK